MESWPAAVTRQWYDYQNKVAELLLRAARAEGLASAHAPRRLPLELLRGYARAMNLYDEALRFTLGQLRRGGDAVQCRTGCTYCCRQMPTGVTPAEIVFLYQGMCESELSARFFRRCLEAQELWSEILCQCRDDAGGKTALEEENVTAAMVRYHASGQFCPFLQNDLCSVYPYRPLACRQHFSLSPPHWCDPAHFQHAHARAFNLEPADTVYEALGVLNERLALRLSDVLSCGVLEFMVNVMQFHPLEWYQ
jgi:Fe-S-cluster containining protein